MECNSKFYTVITRNSVQYSINAIISNQPYRYFGYYKTVHSMYKSGRSFRNVLVHNHFIFTCCCLITRFSTRTTIPSLVQLISPKSFDLFTVVMTASVLVQYCRATMDGIISPRWPIARRTAQATRSAPPKLRWSAWPRGVLLKQIDVIHFKMR